MIVFAQDVVCNCTLVSNSLAVCLLKQGLYDECVQQYMKSRSILEQISPVSETMSEGWCGSDLTEGAPRRVALHELDL